MLYKGIPMLFDTHCHLDLEPLRSELPEVLLRAADAGVDRFLIPGIKPGWWQGIKSLTAIDNRLLAAFGIHPQHADLADKAAFELLESHLKCATAIGEIGLDYTSGSPSREIQQGAFRSQLRIAIDANLPVLVHCRQAFADLLRIMKDENVARVGGLMHAFSGSPETALECIRLGLYISVCGTVTYDNAVRPLKVVREIPLSRLVLETDAPDLSPQPYRGQTNEPAFLIEIARKVAAIKGLSLEEVVEVTTGNAAAALNLDSGIGS